MSVRVKRGYDQPDKNDGYRVLVDRLWPRGMTKKNAHIDEWAKKVAPSTALRKWFKHGSGKWTEFKKKYSAELGEHREEIERLAEKARTQTVTLLFSARNTEQNNALALTEYIKRIM
jgi:uncharacterized protein YeaO (DUF488 family)